MTDKEYTTSAKVATFINETITADISDIIKSVQGYIDKYTGRNFKADTVASIKKYDGNDCQDLEIDDCVEIDKVEVGSNQYGDSYDEVDAGGSNGYYVYPANYSQDAVPICKLHLRSRLWLIGYANQRVTAKWGYSASVPEDITIAATILVASIYKYGQSGVSGGLGGEKIGEYSITYNKDDEGESSAFKEYLRARVMLDKYKRFRIGI